MVKSSIKSNYSSLPNSSGFSDIPTDSSISDDIQLQDMTSNKANNYVQESTVPSTSASGDQTNRDLESADTHSISTESSNFSRELDQLSNFSIEESGKINKIKKFFRLLWNGPLEPSDNPPKRLALFETVEDIPARIRSNISKKIRISLLIFYLTCWALFAYQIVFPYLTKPPINKNGGDLEVIPLSCGGETHFWRGKNAKCGMDGKLCPSFETNEALFRCPAFCDRGSWTFSYIPLGDQMIKYHGYFVGGGYTTKEERNGDETKLTKPYRADSYLCGAAVHAGMVSSLFGGCAKISYAGPQLNFPIAKGRSGGQDSLGFDSFFPSSFFFNPLPGPVSHCYDPRLFILIFNVFLGMPVIFLASGCVAYWTITIVGFWTIILATDPPKIVDAKDPETLARLLSIGLERFLPSCFILYVLWHISLKRTLQDVDPSIINSQSMKPSPLSKLFLWYPLFWLGVLNNITFDRLPVDRLTIHDLKTQPGALTAVSSLILLIVSCAIIQAYKIWKSGRFKVYLCLYIGFITGLTLVASIPGLTLRIHHYILAMLLIPGCATRGVTAMMFQGILIGLFLSGSARWGLASIAETASALRRSDPSGKVTPPAFRGYDNGTGILSWDNVGLSNQEDMKLKGFSLLINDVERYKGDNKYINFNDLLEKNTEFAEIVTQALQNELSVDDNGDISMYVRVGKTVIGGSKYSDFSRAGILKWPSGEFIQPPPGVT